MANQSESPQSRPSGPRKGHHPGARELPFRRPPSPVDKNAKVPLYKKLGALLGKLSITLGMLIIALTLALGLLGGFVLGKLKPEYMVTVQPFEISPEIGNRSSLSSKGASDIVVDVLNDAASHAAQFHGTDYYKYVSTGAQPVSLHQAIRVPIQTSYGIELKGISLDNLLHLYNQMRYEQWIISGDVVSSPNGLVGRIRLNKPDTARYWETPPSSHATASEVVRDATYLMLQSAAPELLGQSYLQQANYEAAGKVFRQWAIDDPLNWKGAYYLSLVYGYQDKAQEASNLAVWSQNILLHEAGWSFGKHRESTGSDKEIASSLAQTTSVALELSNAQDTKNALRTLQQARATLDSRFESKPTNADYWIQRARLLDKEAFIELDLKSQDAYEHSTQAIDSLDKAIEKVPENGGLHEQRAILLLHLVDIMKKQTRNSQDITARETEEAKEYTRALELRPTEDSALWGAVYAQIDLGNTEVALDLARTITLLQPDSKAAGTAYIIALARDIKTPGKDPKREKEIVDRVNQLLRLNPDESQLEAIWNVLMESNHQQAADLVNVAAKTHFPEKPTLAERRNLQPYLVASLAM